MKTVQIHSVPEDCFTSCSFPRLDSTALRSTMCGGDSWPEDSAELSVLEILRLSDMARLI